jgi:hypothetical protein
VIRLACFLALVALGIVVIMALDPGGPTAILFSFVGTPALAAGVLVFGIKRWRDGALSWNRESTERRTA